MSLIVILMSRSISNNLSAQLTCHGTQGIGPIPPHLLHSINATEINIEVVDLNGTVQAMRVGAEIALVANESVPNAFNVAERKLIDDGHAPGQFRVIDVLSPGAMNNSKGECDREELSRAARLEISSVEI